MLKAASVFFVLLALAGGGCGQNSDPTPLRVGVNLCVGYDPFVLAKETGDLEKLGWHLVESVSNVDSARGMRNGTIDATALTLDEAMTLIHDGAEVSVVLALSLSNGADVVLARPDWEKKSLESATSIIAFENTTLSRLILARLIEAWNLDSELLQTQFIAVADHEKAYRSGEIDLLITYEPIASRLEKIGSKRVFDSSELGSEIVNVLVVSSNVVKKDPDRVANLILSWNLGLNRLLSRDPETIGWLSHWSELDSEVYSAIFDRLHFYNFDESMTLLKDERSLLADTVENIGAAIGADGGKWTRELLISHIDSAPLSKAIDHENFKSQKK